MLVLDAIWLKFLKWKSLISHQVCTYIQRLRFIVMRNAVLLDVLFFTQSFVDFTAAYYNNIIIWQSGRVNYTTVIFIFLFLFFLICLRISVYKNGGTLESEKKKNNRSNLFGRNGPRILRDNPITDSRTMWIYFVIRETLTMGCNVNSILAYLWSPLRKYRILTI